MIKLILQRYVSKFVLYSGLIKASPCVNYPYGMLCYIDYKPNKYIHIKQ